MRFPILIIVFFGIISKCEITINLQDSGTYSLKDEKNYEVGYIKILSFCTGKNTPSSKVRVINMITICYYNSSFNALSQTGKINEKNEISLKYSSGSFLREFFNLKSQSAGHMRGYIFISMFSPINLDIFTLDFGLTSVLTLSNVLETTLNGQNFIFSISAKYLLERCTDSQVSETYNPNGYLNPSFNFSFNYFNPSIFNSSSYFEYEVFKNRVLFFDFLTSFNSVLYVYIITDLPSNPTNSLEMKSLKAIVYDKVEEVAVGISLQNISDFEVINDVISSFGKRLVILKIESNTLRSKFKNFGIDRVDFEVQLWEISSDSSRKGEFNEDKCVVTMINFRNSLFQNSFSNSRVFSIFFFSFVNIFCFLIFLVISISASVTSFVLFKKFKN